MGGHAVRDLVAGFQVSMLWLGLVGLATLAGFGLFCVSGEALARLCRLFGKSKVQGVMATAAIVCGVMYGGSKGTYTRSVSFPRTDIEQAYLTDTGSYVTNDLVHVSFNTFLVPQDAWIVLDYWPDGSTNETDIVTAYTATLAEFPQPLDFPFENAISNRWYCYTTWTPGPAVQTNGVWQTIWMTDRIDNRFPIPIRTRVEVDGERVAPPTPATQQEDNDDE